MMTPNLEELAALEAAATPGEWEAKDWQIFSEAHPSLCVCWSATNKGRRNERNQRNMDLVAALRNNAKALIERAKQAERYEAALREIAEREVYYHEDGTMYQTPTGKRARAALETP